MSTEVRSGNKTGYGDSTARKRIIRRKQRKIKLALGIILLLIVLVAVLFINTQLFGGADTKNQNESSQVIPAEDIVLPEWIASELLTINPYSRPEIALDEMTGFVVHYTGNPGSTAEGNRSYFEGLAKTGETYASSNFIIGIDGEIILCVPMDEMAYASNTRNNDTLSIEICHPDSSGKFTDESYNSLIKLLGWLCDTYSMSADTIIRHGDIIDKECPLYYMENPDAWQALIENVKNY